MHKSLVDPECFCILPIIGLCNTTIVDALRRLMRRRRDLMYLSPVGKDPLLAEGVGDKRAQSTSEMVLDAPPA